MLYILIYDLVKEFFNISYMGGVTTVPFGHAFFSNSFVPDKLYKNKMLLN
jgi:hypothetical protein